MEQADTDSELENTKREEPALSNTLEYPASEQRQIEKEIREFKKSRRGSTGDGTEEPESDLKKPKDLQRKRHHRRHEEKAKIGTQDGGSSEKVKVIVRCRPISEKEKLQGHSSIVHVSDDKTEIEVHRPNPASANIVNAKVDKVFTFDAVYDDRTTQSQLYEEVFRDLVDSVLEGFNGTIFAYGQTGTGKTYTMEGVREIKEEQGVIPNAFRHIFDRIKDSPDLTYLVRASYLEIYQEEVKDLLNSKLKICELKENSDGVYIKGLSSFLCRDFDEINKLMSKGNKNRSTGATNMNEHSSRSHAVFMIAVEMSEKWADGESHVKVGRLNLVDLAGSERQGKTGAEGERLKEAVKINLSLSALGNVIGALADGKNGHIPYRDSKLTRLLQDSLGGNSRTIMVATIGPASFNYDETMVTLRYASRAKRIKNKPKINEDPKDAMLRNYQQEIAKLRARLEAKLSQQRDLVSLDESGDSGRQRRKLKDEVEGVGIFDSSLLQELAPYLKNYGLHRHNDPKEILKILEEKRKALMSDTETVKEEKERLINKLESTHKKVQQAEEECSKLYDQIEWLESKVLNGGKTLLDHTNEQQRLIEERQKELDEEKAKEDEMRQKIMEHDLTVVELREIQTKIEAQVQHDGKRLKKIHSKVLKARKLREERTQKQAFDIARLQRYLVHNQKEDEMNKAILDNFVPNKTRYLLESLAQHHSDDSVSFMPITSITLPRPLVNRMTLLPLYNKSLDGTIHPLEDYHYVDENILQLHPLPPVRMTKHYVPPETDPHIKSVMMRALAEAEKDVTIDCNRINQPRRRATTARVRLGELLTYDNNVSVRQVLSAKHRSKEIPYKDFVAVTRVSAEREKSAIPFNNRIHRAHHVSLSPDFLLFPPPVPFSDYPDGESLTCRESSNASIPVTREDYLNAGYNGRRHQDIFGESGPELFDPLFLERAVANLRSNASDEISLRKLHEVLRKRKMMAERDQFRPNHESHPSTRMQGSDNWKNCFYTESLSGNPPPPPSTAVSSVPRQHFNKRPVQDWAWTKELDLEDPKPIPVRTLTGDCQFPNIERNTERFRKKSPRRLQKLLLDQRMDRVCTSYRSPEETIPYREARQAGLGFGNRRDPATSRANCYPPRPKTPTSSRKTSSGFSSPMSMGDECVSWGLSSLQPMIRTNNQSYFSHPENFLEDFGGRGFQNRRKSSSSIPSKTSYASSFTKKSSPSVSYRF